MRHIDHALVETTRPQAYKAWLYWGKKPPNIVRAYLDNYCPAGGVVLDPFVGSGVAALEAADSGRRAIAVDLNPVGLFLAEDIAFENVITGLVSSEPLEGNTTSTRRSRGIRRPGGWHRGQRRR